MLTFLSIALLHFLAVVAPGPDFAMVVKNSMLYEKRLAIYTALGIALGIIVHVTYCILGLAIVIANSPLIFNMIKYLGAAYLIYIGIKSLLAKEVAKNSELHHDQPANNITAWQAVQQGFLCNALNPKASLFFLGLFTLVIKQTTPSYIEIGYGVWMVSVTFIWFAFLASIITHAKVRAKIFRVQPIVIKVMGILLIAFGLQLIFLHHHI